MRIRTTSAWLVTLCLQLWPVLAPGSPSVASAAPTASRDPPATRCFASGNAKSVKRPRAQPRSKPIDAALMVGLWRNDKGSNPAIILCFDDAHRLAASLSYKTGRSIDALSDKWTWIIRGGRIDVTLIDEDGTTVHEDCRITLQNSQRVFVLSSCHRSAKTVDLSGTWTFLQSP